jgi:hypothetical protein
MTHSHLTQWIEDADGRQFCRAASWSRIPATHESESPHLGEAILKIPAAIGSYALACTRRIARMSGNVDPDRPSPTEPAVSGVAQPQLPRSNI